VQVGASTTTPPESTEGVAFDEFGIDRCAEKPHDTRQS
jgi:hypothetical protein